MTLSPEQQQWVETMKAARTSETDPRLTATPRGPLHRLLQQAVQSSLADQVAMVLIFASIAVMACYYWRIEEDVEAYAAYTLCLRLIAYAFYVEAALKLFALGPSVYFGDAWCRFDFFLVLATAIHESMQNIGNVGDSAMLLRVLRLLRIMRTFRLLKRAHQMRSLLFTLLVSLPMLVNVGGILAIIIFMYAVVGVDRFGFLQRQEHIDERRNFESFGNAVLLLFQCLTGDGWSGLMTDAMVAEGGSACSGVGGVCGSWIAGPFFLSFQVAIVRVHGMPRGWCRHVRVHGTWC